MTELGRAAASWLLAGTYLSSGQERSLGHHPHVPTQSISPLSLWEENNQSRRRNNLQVSLDETFPFSVEHLEGMENGLLGVCT